jgi:hypothetical protein
VMDSEAGGGFYIPFGRIRRLNIGYRIRHLSNGGTGLELRHQQPFPGHRVHGFPGCAGREREG